MDQYGRCLSLAHEFDNGVFIAPKVGCIGKTSLKRIAQVKWLRVVVNKKLGAAMNRASALRDKQYNTIWTVRANNYNTVW